MSRIQSWEVSDAFWNKVEPLIPGPERNPEKAYRRKPGGGRKPIPPRRIFEAILYVLRTGCQWKALPKERFGSPSAIHTHFLRWTEAGFFIFLWRAGLPSIMRWRALPGVGKSVDGAMIKAPLPLRPSDTIRRTGEKNGSKRHLLVDGRGVPLSIVVTGANRHDVTQLELVLDEIVITRPECVEQHLCADKGYSGEPAYQAIMDRNYIPHIKQRGKNSREKADPEYKTRRWVFEVAHSWFNRFRKILVRYENSILRISPCYIWPLQ